MAEVKKTDEKRYDRQLRLWGEEGQSRLEATHLALLNATATGTETLKNLILPGVGQFTIVDGHNVTEKDVGNNFFVDDASLGKNRAEVTLHLLQELNPLSSGHTVTKDPVSLIEHDISFYKQFSIIVATDIPEENLLKLAAFCWKEHIPLVVARSFGFLGYIRVAVPEHTIVEAKPDNPPDDLRLAEPFPELAEYAKSFDFDKMDSTDHSHTPFIIILLRALEQYKAEHGGKVPETRPEKEAFKSAVIRGARNAQEENFNEAYRQTHKALLKSTIPSNTRSILEDSHANNITANSSKFWIMAHALKGFVDNEGHGKLPLMGNIPDMTASTNGYIALQKIYQDKAQADLAAVAARVRQTLHTIGKADNFITQDEIKSFCKNVLFLQVLRYRSLETEYNSATAKKSTFSSEQSNETSLINFYLALRASDRFFTKHKRHPGTVDKELAADTQEVTNNANHLCQELGINPIDAKYVQEIVNYGATELHTLGSLIGGIASQEVIKLITHQYTPLDNTLIFNGLNSISAVYQL